MQCKGSKAYYDHDFQPTLETDKLIEQVCTRCSQKLRTTQIARDWWQTKAVVEEDWYATTSK